jgi:putative membrane protein
VAGGAHSYLGKLLYARAAELPPGAGHSAAEVEVAARWMYYAGDVVELLLAAALFAAWYRGAGRAARLRRA